MCQRLSLHYKNIWLCKQSMHGRGVMFACQCHKYARKDKWTNIGRSIRQLSPFRWQKQHLTDSLGKSPVANHHLSINHPLPPACQSANSVDKTCHGSFSDWFWNIYFQLNWRKECSKWLKRDNSIKCCRRTSLTCGKRSRVLKVPLVKY